MPGLNTSLLNALQALRVNQGALQAATNNISNANTPGYTRQIPVLTQNNPIQDGSVLYGTGVSLQKYQSVRDRVLDILIAQQTQKQGSSDAQVTALQQVETAFTTNGQDIGSQMSAFFTAISSLSSDPTNALQRQNLISAASNLTNAFHRTVTAVRQVQSGIDTSVVQDVNQINQLTKEISSLNAQLYQLRGTGQDGGALQDRQTELIRQLSQLTSISVVQTENGETITTGAGIPLVVGADHYDLRASIADDGKQHVFAGSEDITASLTDGKLGGELQVRDQTIANILQQLDQLAYDFANAFNAAHRTGFDQNGNPGQNFFNAPAAVSGAASQIGVLISDPKVVAASSDGSPGSNGNLSQLLAIQNQKLSSGNTPTESYSGVVFAVGSATAAAKSDSAANQLSLQQLENQRSAISGVSIDEESTNLIRFQQAYAAAAQVINVITQLNSVTLNMMS